MALGSPRKKLVPLVLMGKEEDEQEARIDELANESA